MEPMRFWAVHGLTVLLVMVLCYGAWVSGYRQGLDDMEERKVRP